MSMIWSCLLLGPIPVADCVEVKIVGSGLCLPGLLILPPSSTGTLTLSLTSLICKMGITGASPADLLRILLVYDVYLPST